MMSELERLRELAVRQATQIREQEATIAEQQRTLDGAVEWGADLLAANEALKQAVAESELARIRAEQRLSIATYILMRVQIGSSIQKVVA